jgi:hypothetical protein
LERQAMAKKQVHWLAAMPLYPEPALILPDGTRLYTNEHMDAHAMRFLLGCVGSWKTWGRKPKEFFHTVSFYQYPSYFETKETK